MSSIWFPKEIDRIFAESNVLIIVEMIEKIHDVFTGLKGSINNLVGFCIRESRSERLVCEH
jgi:hypothetical protein